MSRKDGEPGADHAIMSSWQTRP